MLQELIVQSAEVRVPQGFDAGQALRVLHFEDGLHELDTAFGHLAEIAAIEADLLLLEVRIRGYRKLLIPKKHLLVLLRHLPQ